jgi:peptide/nickel transport system substrate-binding protein
MIRCLRRLALTAFVCAAAACGPRAAERPLRIALYGAPSTLDPHLASDFLSFSVASNVYEALTRLDTDLKVQPALAEAWENPDASHWRFRLRPGVRFQDGRACAAEDVVASLERARQHPRSAWRGYLASMRGVAALDPGTVEISTDGPDALLLSRLSFVMILPRDAPAEITAPVGTGPYRMSWGAVHDRLLLHAFRGYWGAAASEAEAEVTLGVTLADSLAGGSDQKADVIQVLDPVDTREIQGAPGYRLVSTPGVTTDYLRLRVSAPPFSDPRVRQALDLALDRDALVRRQLHGHGRPANQLVGSEVFGHDPSLPAAVRDLPRARQLLAEAGFGGGVDVDMEFREGRVVDEIVRELGEAGIRARPLPRRWDELMQRLRDDKVSLYYGGIMADSGDASEVLAMLRRAAGPVVSEPPDVHSAPRLDALLDAADREPNNVDRQGLLQRCLRIVMDEKTVVPLALPDDVYAVAQGVRFLPRPDGRVLAIEVHRGPASP